MMNDDKELLLVDNTEKNQYEFVKDGLLSRIKYAKAIGKIYLIHTEIPTQLEGKGIGPIFIRKVLEDVERQGLELIPHCSIVAAFIRSKSRVVPIRNEWNQN